LRPADRLALTTALALMLGAISAVSRTADRESGAVGRRSTVEWTDGIVDSKSIPVDRNPRFGTSILMAGDGTKSVHLRTSLNMHGGTVSFWIRPEWPADANESHTLLSAQWDDGRKSYFVVSQGWWEPTGDGRLYFVASNEDAVHCSAARQLPPKAWSLVTVTWASGAHGFCRLYVDDELLAETQRSWAGTAKLTTISLGSDEFASNGRGRVARAELGALQIFNHPMSHREVITRYRLEEDPSAVYQKKWAWLEEVANGSPLEATKYDSAKTFDKVIFDEDMNWAKSPAAIDDRLRRIAEAGFTIYVPCVWHGRGTAFPSRLAPFDSRLAMQASAGWDPLGYLVAQAHARGIAVHPWFTVVRREDHAHPEWAEAGTPEGAFDIHQAGFRDFAAELMLDVVARYKVDGLNLDYIRAMGVCLSSYCQHDYRDRTGSDLVADYSNGAPNPSARSRIQAWQDDAVGDLVQKLSAQAHAINPAIAVSVDGHAVADEAQRPLEGRNELVWANREWIDAIYHMDYRPVVDIKALNSAATGLKDPSRLRMLVANYDLIDETPVPRSGLWISRVMRYAQDRRHDSGVGVYLYSRLNDEQIRALR